MNERAAIRNGLYFMISNAPMIKSVDSIVIILLMIHHITYCTHLMHLVTYHIEFMVSC